MGSVHPKQSVRGHRSRWSSPLPPRPGPQQSGQTQDGVTGCQCPARVPPRSMELENKRAFRPSGGREGRKEGASSRRAGGLTDQKRPGPGSPEWAGWGRPAGRVSWQEAHARAHTGYLRQRRGHLCCGPKIGSERWSRKNDGVNRSPPFKKRDSFLEESHPRGRIVGFL